MTSEAGHRADSAFVWVWLPGCSQPVVAGRLDQTRQQLDGHPVLLFTYARSYRARAVAIALFTPGLPLAPGTFDPTGDNQFAGPSPS